MKTKRALAVLLSLMMMVSMLSISAFAASSVTFKVEASVTDAVAGDTVTYTVSMVEPVSVYNYEFILDIPEGLTYVAGSGVIDATFATKFMGAAFLETNLKSTSMCAVDSINGFTGDQITVMTFQCTVDGDVGGDLTVGLKGAKFVNENMASVVATVDTSAAAVTVPCPHSWDEGKVTTEPGCETVGVKTFTCGLCGETKTEDVPAVGHIYGDAACDAPATCTVCGASTGEALGHSFTNYVSDGNATCTEDGTKTAKCDRCDATDTIADEGSALGHSFSDPVVTKEPTCTEPGEKAGTCSVCGETTTEEIPALGHAWDEGVVTTEPTCDTAGVKTFTCATCQETKTEAIKALGHNYVDGFCSVCGKEKPVADITPTGPEAEEQPAEDDKVELPFTDVKENDWFYNDVVYAYENGLMNGVSATAFGPYTNTTRGMIVTILWRMDGQTAPLHGCQFADVAAGSYYELAIAWAAENGIVTGFSATEFKPDANITREQFAAIMYRYAQYKGYDVSVGESTNILSYGDAESVSKYAIPAMQWACGAGLINGIDGNLVPAGNATRAQAAAILHRFCENVK